MPIVNGQVNELKTSFGNTNTSASDLGKYINENLIPYLQDQSDEINNYTLPALDDFKEILSEILENCKELSEIDLSDLLE
jgi:hypothetical protein